MSDEPNIVPLLSRALVRIRSTPPRVIASPPTQPRRAAVALVLRISPSASSSSPPLPPTDQSPASLTEFFEQEWVNAPGARPEILFLRRDRPEGVDSGAERYKKGEAHVAFPGGRMEEGDEGGLYTAMRQTWEEIGLDLAEKFYMSIGQLDDREITTSLGKRLLMILSPFVFLQVTPAVPPPDPAPTTTLHWIPLSSLLPSSSYPTLSIRRSLSLHTLSSPALTSPSTPSLPSTENDLKNLKNKMKTKRQRMGREGPRWSTVTIDAASRLAPRHSTILKVLVRVLVGTMRFPAIVLDIPSPSSALDSSNEKTPRTDTRHEDLKLWGLSLGMTLDLLSYMVPPSPSPSSPTYDKQTERTGAGVWLPFYSDEVASVELVGRLAPSLTSVVPRFGYPDVNFWIWVFGKRYREVVRGWEVSIRTGGTNDRRINWPGTALSTFYAAIRKALVVVIVVRAIAILFGVVGVFWWVFW